MSEDVKRAVQILDVFLTNLNIKVNNLHLVKSGNNGEYVLSWSTSKGDYQIPIVFVPPLISTFKLHNIPVMKAIEINNFADTVLYSIIYNMGAAGDTEPVEFFFTALCTYWDQIFIDTLHDYFYRINDAMKLLKGLVYKNPKADIDPHKWIHNPKFLLFYISSPSGNRLYYSGRLHERPDITKVRKGELY